MISIFFSLVHSLSLSLSLSSHPWTSAGFSLKLIHRDSPLSPLYQPNLTNFQRFFKNADSSRARALYFQQEMDKGSSKARLNPSIHIPARLEDPVFVVEIGIGTPAVKRILLFDTGSDLTWTQCSPCNRCFRQNYPLLEPRRSTSYKSINNTHPLAREFTCNPSSCSYQIGYFSGQSTAGAVATETFTFVSRSGSPVALPNIVFGCGTNNAGQFPPDVSGILGMNTQPSSFARQLEGLSRGRFSYCLSPLITKKPTSYVKFGDEAKIGGWWKAKKTPFLSKARKSDMFYIAEVTDLSINGRKLRLGRSAFPNGCIIDSGASLTLLGRPAFSAARDFLVNYFSKFKGVARYTGSDHSIFLCFSVPAGFASFPTMTFHFRGADYRVPPSNLFFSEKRGVYCLAMMETSDTNILGAFQQRNVRIVYDLKERTLSFAPEDCSRDLK